MKNVAAYVIVTVVAVLCSGCAGLRGTWKLAQIVPADAAGEYQMARVTFNPDGTFTAEVHDGETTRAISGTFEFDRENEKLTFATDDGKPRTYRAQMCQTCDGLLIVWNDGPQKRWEAKMMRR